MRIHHVLLIACLIATCSCRTVRESVSPAEYEEAFSSEPHQVKLLVNGQDALRERVRFIRSAKTSIDLQTFIWRADECGQLIFLELAKAAERGVRVRLLCDYLFAVNDPEIIAAASRVPQLEMRLYNPVSGNLKSDRLTLARRGLFFLEKTNQRMHNKMMLVDGAVGLCGGRNIENTYFHESEAMNFKDLEIVVKGPVVQDMQASFTQFWTSKLAQDVRTFKDVKRAITEETYKSKDIRKIEQSELYGRVNQILADPELTARDMDGYSTVRKIAFFSDEPGKNKHARSFYGSSYLNEILVYNISRAKTKVWIQTPYVVLSKRARATFKKLRTSNPDLDIRISSNSMAATDNWMTYAFLYKNKRYLIEDLGVRLYEFNPLPADLYDYFPNYDAVLKKRTGKSTLDQSMIATVSPQTHPFLCIHAKSMLIDDRISFVGSYNLDPRSANLNTELTIMIDDPEFASILRRYFEKDFETRNSWLVWKRKEALTTKLIMEPMGLINTTGRKLTTLDLWPYQNCSCYILKEGAAPVSPGHHDFFNNYDPVGNFPRMPAISEKEAMSRLLKATGKFVQPIL